MSASAPGTGRYGQVAGKRRGSMASLHYVSGRRIRGMGNLGLHQRSNSQPPFQTSGSTSSQRSDALAQEAQVAEVALYDVLKCSM